MSTSVSGSSSINGLRSNPNVISGLVSGLDTESMIEGLVDSYSQKITGYQQQIVLQEWKQEAYRDVISNLNDFMSKYTNFSSSSTSTNLLSNALFNNCTTTTAQGSNSDAVKVTGSTDSTVTIDSVLQVASSSTYVSGNVASENEMDKITGEEVNLGDDYVTGDLSGTISIKYNSSTISIKLTSDDVITSSQDLADLINEQLKSSTIDNDPANTKFTAEVDDSGNIYFNNIGGGGNAAYITSASSSLKSSLGISPSTSYNSGATTINVGGKNFDDFSTRESVGDALVGTKMTFEFNGSTKTITIEDFGDDPDKLIEQINEKLATAYGVDSDGLNNLSVDNISNTGFQLEFSTTLSGTNSFSVSCELGEEWGLGGTKASNTFTSDSTLESINSDFSSLGGTLDIGNATVLTNAEYKAILAADTSLDQDKEYSLFAATGGGTWNSAAGCYFDNDGDVVVSVGGNFYKTDDEGNLRLGESIEINGTSVGTFDGESTISDVLNAINSGNCGCSVSFSTLTNNFVFSSDDVGSNSTITIGEGLAEKLFGSTDETSDYYNEKNQYNQGQDCIVFATVNGEQVELTRSSNNLSLEGLTVTVSSTFNNTTVGGETITSVSDYNAALEAVGDAALDATDKITFTETTDYDPIVDAITSMIDDYNALMTELKTLFTEVPLSNTSGSSYLPLTDEDAASMTESAVAKYEANAKTGLLFGDSNMRSLYNSLSGVFSASGAFGADLYAMGIECEYGTWTDDHVTLDSSKLIEMLQTDPSRVQAAFTTSTSSGGSVDGVMQTLKNKMDDYGSTTGATKGILVEAAGTELSPMSLLTNTMQTKIESFQSLIETWESKLESKITYYTSQFSKLEVLMSQANSQSSTLSSLGGY